MKIILTFLLSIISINIYCQLGTNEEDIIWQVETEFEYQLENDSLLNFEYNSSTDSIAGSSEVKTVKIDLKKYYSHPNVVLRSFLLKSAEKGIFPTYTISDNKKIPPKEIGRILSPIDSIITFDPETGEQRISYFLDDFNLSYVESLIIKQGWYYQQKNNQLYT